MILELFAVRDDKATFSEPIFAPNLEFGLRLFRHLANEEKHPWSVYADDHHLFHIATFDRETGEVVPVVPPRHIATAFELKEASTNAV